MNIRYKVVIEDFPDRPMRPQYYWVVDSAKDYEVCRCEDELKAWLIAQLLNRECKKHESK